MGGSLLLLSRVFETNIYFLSSLFLGLTVAALPFVIYEERAALKRRYWWLILTLLGAAIVVVLTAFRNGLGGIENLNFQNLSVLDGGYLFFSGVFAVFAMLLPGVSGSTMLLILGVYVPAINAARELLRLHMQYLPGVVVLAFGALAGIAFAAKWIRAGLRRFRPQMIYLILGLMLGSLYAIVMGPTTLDLPRPPLDGSTFQVLAFGIGIATLGGLESAKRYAQKNEKM